MEHCFLFITIEKKSLFLLKIQFLINKIFHDTRVQGCNFKFYHDMSWFKIDFGLL